MKKNNTPCAKTEKELLDEAMKRWPEELENYANKVNQSYFNRINEDAQLDLNNEDYILRYCSDCTPWTDFLNEWLK